MDVVELAKTGWNLIAMQPGSKNPGSVVGDNWQHKCSTDEAQVIAWRDAGYNFGVLLGPTSGIIDLEYDSDEGREIIEAACQGVVTPTYKSAKSVHRLFAYDSRFEPEKAKFGWKGTEWRFGQDKAQSVIPPSIHESGIQYEWVIAPSTPLARLPDSLWSLFESLRQESESRQASAPTQDEYKDYGDETIINMARSEIERTSWATLLEAKGWTLVRKRGDATDWRRPNKKRGSLSATVNFGGSGRLAVFSTNCLPLENEKSYDKFGFVCLLDYNDDPISAARNILPKEVVAELDKKWREQQSGEILDIDWANLNKGIDDPDDDQIVSDLVPKSGLLRMVYEFYGHKAYRRSPIMGLAVAVSLCETIFGRRVRSHTDLRTNDYNLILATTGAGKEACESTITHILEAADPSGRFMIPPDVQSGNGLMKALHGCPCSIWVCDEFGKILQAMLDKKGNQHIKNIGNHLLKLYGKSSGTYGGAAHSDGVRNRIVQPHLCVLGLSTSSTVFEAVSTEQVSDGLIGRIAFWPVQDRPEPREDMTIAEPADELLDTVKNWINWQPVSTSDYPQPAIVQMSTEAKARWVCHGRQINHRMSAETELRAAVWSRVAARTMKLALVHRAARLETLPAQTHWDFVLVETEDIEWAIRLSNWLARIACGLVRENVYDKSGTKAKTILLKALEAGEVHKRQLLRAYRSITAGDLQAAADELGLETITENSGGRPKVIYRKRPSPPI